ncbi:MAG: hypothetical protein D6689_20360 [Deltaproteobacteria bacterium]|nr:MAG: hypothetical protein D6689_20360 [Deltaproteobacteria bacterium]
MIPARVYRFHNPAAVFLGLEDLRKRGLTPRGILFIALDPRGETHIAVPDDLDAVTQMKVGAKLTLKPPWEGRYFHFDSIHRLPGNTLLWTGDRRLADAGSAQEVAMSVSEWLWGSSAKSLFLGCTPHQPGAWWCPDDRSAVTALHLRGFVDATVSHVGLMARRIDEPYLYYLSWKNLAQRGALDAWEPIYESPLGNVLLVERRVLGYRLALSCERGIVELDISGAPEDVVAHEVAELAGGYGIVGRIDGGGFAVTRGRVCKWGLEDVRPAELIGAPNETLGDLAAALARAPADT